MTRITTLDLLDRLIVFPAINRDPNRDTVDFIRDYFATQGVDAKVIPTEDGRKDNLFAKMGPKDGRASCSAAIPAMDMAFRDDERRVRTDRAPPTSPP